MITLPPETSKRVDLRRLSLFSKASLLGLVLIIVSSIVAVKYVRDQSATSAATKLASSVDSSISNETTSQIHYYDFNGELYDQLPTTKETLENPIKNPTIIDPVELRSYGELPEDYILPQTPMTVFYMLENISPDILTNFSFYVEPTSNPALPPPGKFTLNSLTTTKGECVQSTVNPLTWNCSVDRFEPSEKIFIEAALTSPNYLSSGNILIGTIDVYYYSDPLNSYRSTAVVYLTNQTALNAHPTDPYISAQYPSDAVVGNPLIVNLSATNDLSSLIYSMLLSFPDSYNYVGHTFQSPPTVPPKYKGCFLRPSNSHQFVCRLLEAHTGVVSTMEFTFMPTQIGTFDINADIVTQFVDTNPDNSHATLTTAVSAPLGIEIDQFDGKCDSSEAYLSWTTLSEIQILGFDLWGATDPNQTRTKLTPTMIPAINPGSMNGNTYDYNVSLELLKSTETERFDPSIYYFWLQDWTIGGGSSETGPVELTCL